MVVAALTILIGVGVLLAPRLFLGLLAAGTDGVGQFFLRAVGLLVLLFGGLLSQALLSPAHGRVILFWAGLEKLGFAAAMTAGYATSTFGPFAIAVALVDLVSGLIVFGYRRSLRDAPGR